MTKPVSIFRNVPLAPPDPIFHLTANYKADPFPDKIDLGIGAYRDEAGKPWILPVVQKAEALVVGDPQLDHEYLPILGLKAFRDASVRVILGADSPAVAEGRAVGAQSISGTGALRIGAEFLRRFRDAATTVYISNPTWGNHRAIFEDAGFAVQTYPYWDAAARGLDIDGLLAALRAAPQQSIIVLHACAHNPTGVDPTAAQWRQIAEVCRERAHFPFFDCAYQGFASGSLDRDAAAVRAFVADGFELFVAQSYSKNFGLYGERVGCLTVVAHEPAVAQHIESQLAKITRAMISNPPSHGARIVSRVITDAGLMAQWQRELETMAGRIRAMRQALFTHLQQLGTPGTWQHIVDQIGMFSYTGLSPAQCQTLIDQHHVYLSSNGRISMAGLNEGNVERFARAVDQVVRQS